MPWKSTLDGSPHRVRTLSLPSRTLISLLPQRIESSAMVGTGHAIVSKTIAARIERFWQLFITLKS
jgi:hypothetical protein